MNKTVVGIISLIVGGAIGAGAMYQWGVCQSQTQTKKVIFKLQGPGSNNGKGGISLTETKE